MKTETQMYFGLLWQLRQRIQNQWFLANFVQDHMAEIQRKQELGEECAAKKMSRQEEKDINFLALHNTVQWIVEDSETERIHAGEQQIANKGKVL